MLSPWRLRLLVQLESLGTVRAVAEALAMSPSSVSQQLSVLQQEARATLLEHHGRRVTLTPAGLRLAAHAREILRAIEAAETDLTERRTEPVGEVRVAAFSSALRAVVLPVAAELGRTHPRLRITVTELEPHDSLRMLRRGEVDLAVVYDFADGWLPVDPQVRYVPLGSDPVVLVLPQGHPHAEEDAPELGGMESGGIELGAMAGERWAMDRPTCYLSDLVLRRCRQAGFEPEIAGHYGSYPLLLDHVRLGLAVAALPALAVDARDGVVVRPIVPSLTRIIRAALPAGPVPAAAVELVLERLRAHGV
ncbi:LysR substrate-binding domain-containing protein [Allokutzneria sp. A3M-2-11 16]|uniref:LysR substrate-binding domain-containing protein n=1 Tax=Allokutzneria sp. A3M-2-11 16 TaxID=2962043 RepID=UPI0020B64028|nr:LysR substrate-binding domain-containing protein [Allokutzneria sp. A3M-2-11 16]MCP3803162.1 LysR substrate-binding domain-containing protein [Allokutzneria sp. A3M-2-11 16]